MPGAGRRGEGVYAYLAADAPETPRLAHALALSGVPAEAFVRGAGPAERRELARRGVTVHDRPPPLADRLASRAVLLHHGGQGAAQVALGLGRPQLLAPRYGDQRLTAERLERLSCGRVLDATGGAEALAATIAGIAADAALVAAAGRLAADMAADPAPSLRDMLVAEVERLAGRGPPLLPPAILADAVPAAAAVADGAPTPVGDRSALLAAALGLMRQSPLHRTYSVADLERLILPPIRLGQCRLYRHAGRAAGFVTWALARPKEARGGAFPWTGTAEGREADDLAGPETGFLVSSIFTAPERRCGAENGGATLPSGHCSAESGRPAAPRTPGRRRRKGSG